MADDGGSCVTGQCTSAIIIQQLLFGHESMVCHSTHGVVIAATNDMLDFPAAHVIRQQDAVPSEAQFGTDIKEKVS